MKVEDVMTKPARACAPTDSLHTAAEIMWESDCGCVPVTDREHRAVGMITDRDICMAAHLEGQPLRARTVDSAMSSAPQVCHCEDSLQEAAAIMRENRVRRLPVVDRNGRLAGVVSINDLVLEGTHQERGAAGLAAEEIVATLTAICEHRPSRGSAEPR